VHVGVIFVAEAAGRPVSIRETEKLDGAFVAPADVLRVYDRLETWSALLYDFMTARASGVRIPTRSA
jgi:predicted NUDIX family phosphoesterase